MGLFLLMFFIIYGAMHGYFLLRLRGALQLGPTATVVIALLLLLLVVTPLVIRLLDGWGHEVPARILAWGADTWMGILFLFVTAGMLMELYRVTAFAAAFVLPLRPFMLRPTPAVLFLLPLIFALVAGSWGFWQALQIRSTQVTIPVTTLPLGRDRLTIVQISDVHLGLLVREKRLAKILEQVRQASPDILVVTGDLVDGQIADMTGLAEPLRAIRPPFGKFAVIGNHEYYVGLDQALSFIDRCGFILLRDAWRQPLPGIAIAGVDDPAGRGFGRHSSPGEAELLSQLPADAFRILLKHRPVVDAASAGHFDLQLSGHVHGGQIYPFTILTHLAYPVPNGLSHAEKGS
ncbi:MAG TPA: metallophosphoesterase, partial [Geobacterales bacterium]|nr:metallophosphoesterase [Geobacterales bacterium]